MTQFPGEAQGRAQHAGQHGRLCLQRRDADRADAGAGARSTPTSISASTSSPAWSRATHLHLPVRRLLGGCGHGGRLLEHQHGAGFGPVASSISTIRVGSSTPRARARPPAKLGPQAGAHHSMICNGCIVRGQVMRSVLSPGVYVSPGAVVRESVIMNDTWIGPGAVVDRCIVDKNVVVGAGTQLGWGEDLRHAQRSSIPIASTPARPSSAKARTSRRQADRPQRGDPDRCGRRCVRRVQRRWWCRAACDRATLPHDRRGHPCPLLAMILAGGEGPALSVLTALRSEAAVPFGGKYRIIDFSLSNCVNSGIFDVAVLTQYQPRSLNEHIGVGRPWDLDRTTGGVRLLQPYQSTAGERGRLAGGHRRRAALQPGCGCAHGRGCADPGRRPHLQDGLPAHAALPSASAAPT